MKAFQILLLNFILLILPGGLNVYAQTVAIGHVSAEVVESISAASQAITGFNLKGGSLLTEKGNLNYENVDLGKFKINSGADITCNVMMKPAALSDVNGNALTIEPSVTVSKNTDGNQTLQLEGKARLMQDQTSGLYQGSYTMIFAYN